MSLQHFFLENQDFGNEVEASADGVVELQLTDEDLHHAKVLRLKAGEHIGVIDSASRFFEVEIVEAGNKLLVKNSKNASVKRSNCNLWLAQGISKGSKFDDVVRACTEVGVYGFIPVAFERSVSKLDAKKEANKIERWQKIAKSAAMQSGQFAIPKIAAAVNVNELCEQLSDFDCVFVCWEEADGMQEIVDVCNKIKTSEDEQNIAIVIGPEGGITTDEVKQLESCNENCHVVSIGDSILRTETAGVVASAIIKFNLAC